MKYTFIVSEWDNNESYKPGDEVLVLQMEDINSGAEWYNISKGLAAEGCPGNVNHNIKCFHGWRGTTNNISRTACGVYSIKKVERMGDYEERVKVTINRTDLRKGAE